MGLRDAKLKSFPDEVLELDRSVRTLDLTHNKLADIPEEISKFVNMQRLILAENIIERLPGNVGKLQSLKLLNLDQNRVTFLPDECNNTKSSSSFPPSHENCVFDPFFFLKKNLGNRAESGIAIFMRR